MGDPVPEKVKLPPFFIIGFTAFIILTAIKDTIYRLTMPLPLF